MNFEYDSGLYKPRNRPDLKWYAVDLDNTIAEGVWPDCDGIGQPIEENMAKLELVREAGYKVIIHTARSWNEHENIDAWLTDHNIRHEGIVCGKPLSHRYVDDKAINSEEKSWV